MAVMEWHLGHRPIHSPDIPTGTLHSIERQGTSALGRRWLVEGPRKA